MQVVDNTLYRDYESSVSPKGQITLPHDMRQRWGMKPKDTVTIRVFEDGHVAVLPKDASFLESYRAIPALHPPRTFEEIRAVAWEEHTQEVAHKGV